MDDGCASFDAAAGGFGPFTAFDGGGGSSAISLTRNAGSSKDPARAPPELAAPSLRAAIAGRARYRFQELVVDGWLFNASKSFKVQVTGRAVPGLLISIHWPSGSTSYYAHADQYWDDVHHGRLPVFPRQRIPGADSG